MTLTLTSSEIPNRVDPWIFNPLADRGFCWGVEFFDAKSFALLPAFLVLIIGKSIFRRMSFQMDVQPVVG